MPDLTTSDEVTPEQGRALEIAREMARVGIPIFVCPPNPFRPGKYYFKADWQNTVADPTAIDQWRPGWGIAAVGGHAADFLDMDPRSGGIESQTELKNAGLWPYSFGQQATPSGGTHDVISASGERKETAFMPGLDFQAGAREPDENGGYGRAFIWIAPTVGANKATGEPVAYRWVHPPDLEALNEWRRDDGSSSDTSIEGIIARVYAKRARKHEPARTAGQGLHEADSAFVQSSQIFGSAHSPFTKAEAERFLEPLYVALQNAEIGSIEEAGMAFTLGIEHFVPAFWSVQEAYAVILEGLKSTAYDPNGPSDWTADKFLARLDGRRPVPGSWKAELRTEDVREVTPAPDAVDALLAEMLKPSEVISRPAPRPLVKGLLNLDSESWIIGAPGSKKSFVALDLAGHVARGMPWQGLKVTQARVVMVVAEGAGGLGGRLAAWERSHGAMGDDVYILPRPVQAAALDRWAVLIEACRRIGPGLVVLDTQARVTVGLEENSARDMGIYIEAVRAIREATGACVLTVHHTGRNGGDARGSSAIDGAQGTELKVIRQDSMTGALRVEKQKDLEERPEVPLHFERVVIGVDEDGDDLSSLVLLDSSQRNAWYEAAGKTPLPEDWALNWPEVQERILTVLVDQGASIGLTKNETRTNVAARWYGGKVVKTLKSDAGALTHSTFDTAWSRVLAEMSPDGDPIVAEGATKDKKVVDSMAREAWAKRP